MSDKQSDNQEEPSGNMGVWMGVALCGGVVALMLIGWFFKGTVEP